MRWIGYLLVVAASATYYLTTGFWLTDWEWWATLVPLIAASIMLAPEGE